MSKLDSLQKEIEELNQRIIDLQTQNDSLKSENSDLKLKLEEFENGVDNAIDQIDEMALNLSEEVNSQILGSYTGEEKKPISLGLLNSNGKTADKIIIRADENYQTQGIFGDHKTATLEIEGFESFVTDKDILLVNNGTQDGVYKFDKIELNANDGNVLTDSLIVSLEAGMTCNPYLKFEIYSK